MIDLRSDTVTKPSDEMRDAARNADVGDDVYRDDPTVNQLEAAAAAAVGMEAALFVPSGTMGNQIAVRVHTERGNELLLDSESHIYRWELAGAAQLAQVQTRIIDSGDRCVPTPAQIHDNYVAEDLHRPGTGLLTLENTHNYRGGTAVPKDAIDAAATAAHELDVPVHLDGARLFNAAVALETPAPDLLEHVDTVMFCLSKGLGAPIGSILAGPQSFIDQARRTRKLLGGGMRQAGIIAAPGLLALENIDRLGDDHKRATRLAAGLDEIAGLAVPTPDTNIVVVDSSDADLSASEFVAECAGVDVLGGAFNEYITRFCTNWDVTDADIDVAIDRIDSVLH
ncbi:threonine aldolase family protein [Natronocalculus amylovorans]|uniref:Beta-eliminating lyase-related protein n=1 Tax=Natronocalculus amylovorans TaxID=2917812 RepID=A0AAE3FUJ1_9EURY|nr:GntG family PLP-dependent aldolase [Natronocalculus amylovorans]MCL9815837.1 beta-eliminating lyase-related protein [Natronocalculus amylovorans]